jgi:hypothetical protein
VSDGVSAGRIKDDTRDFIVATLTRELEGADFERFVAHLLQQMGYRTRVTQASGDGGVDIIACQCARSTSWTADPTAPKLRIAARQSYRFEPPRLTGERPRTCRRTCWGTRAAPNSGDMTLSKLHRALWRSPPRRSGLGEPVRVLGGGWRFD